MSAEHYRTALKAGKKDLQTRTTQKLPTELPSLDAILETEDISCEVPLGLLDIPVELIVGTKTRGRTSSFAPNFMPILGEGTEFAAKWTLLSDAHIQEGIRDPIVAYEYMNHYYVLEGNKRVSVLKFFGATSIPGYVTRVVPVRKDTKESRIYYEFLDFYNSTSINYLFFTQEGRYVHTCHLVGYRSYERWSMDDRIVFRSCYNRFSDAFAELGGKKLKITAGDAMVMYMDLFGYAQLVNESPAEIKTNLEKMWEEFELTETDDKAAVKLDPSPEQKKNIFTKIFSPADDKNITQIAFVHRKTAETSSWTYAHELGRLYLNDAFHGRIHTTAYDNITDSAQALDAIEQAIASGSKMIFTTSPEFLPASLKAAVNHPDVKILNCSLNSSHKYIRTYYGRMFEAKFLIGVLAGIMTDTEKIGYIADYPIYGMTANINAFALGVKMVNPKAKVYLEWSTLKENEHVDLTEKLYAMGVTFISSQDMITPQHMSRRYGLYRINGETPVNLAFPVWDWGKYYERIIWNVQNGVWNDEKKSESAKSLLYWWGMSADVIDVLWSSGVPTETKHLLDSLRNSIRRYDFSPFDGILHGQEGIVQADPNHRMTQQEIITIDWLADNIIGTIPSLDELREDVHSFVKQEGLRKGDSTK
jgi:basic membrane lipoprotein Med (substrate-binding protein (PBP1-ABC) superfamily)